MLGRHVEELLAARFTVENLAIQLMELTSQLQCLRPRVQAIADSHALNKPWVNNPPCYCRHPIDCRTFLTQCKVVFSLYQATYMEDRSKIAFVLSILTGQGKRLGHSHLGV